MVFRPQLESPARWTRRPSFAGSLALTDLTDRSDQSRRQAWFFGRATAPRAPSIFAVRLSRHLHNKTWVDMITHWPLLTEVTPDSEHQGDFLDTRDRIRSTWRLRKLRSPTATEGFPDNADHSAEYLARVRSSASGYMSVPFSDDVELSMRLGCVVRTDAKSGKQDVHHSVLSGAVMGAHQRRRNDEGFHVPGRQMVLLITALVCSSLLVSTAGA